MSKESKRVLYFLGALCLLVSILGMFGGCDRKEEGVQGLIYHEGILIAKTSCDYDMTFEINPSTVLVQSISREYGSRFTRAKYQYENDGKYTVERKECEY